MSYRIQPVAKRIGWHTFRRTYTTLLHVYAQAMTPAKRKAQGKVVAMLRDTEKKSS